MQKHSLRVVLFCSLWLMSASYLWTQSFSLSGTVRESASGEAIIGASITVYQAAADGKAEGKALGGAYTNKYGFYSIPNLQTRAAYTVVVRRTGFVQMSQALTIAEKSVVRNFVLERSDIRMQSVSVQSERLQASAVSTVELSAQAIKRLPSVGSEADVLRALQLMPGVKAANEISSGLYVRGSSPEQTLILFDGVTIYNPAHLFGIFSSFNPDAVSDLRLYKGAFPAEYGGRLSSVLDITMKEGSKERLGGSASVSLLSAHAFFEGPISEKASFMLSGRSMYLGALGEALQPQNIPRYNFYDLNGKVTAQLSENDRISLSGYYGRDDLKSPASEGGINFGWGNIVGQAKWQHIFSESFFSTLSVSYSRYNYDYSQQPNPRILAEIVYNSTSFIADINTRLQGNYLGLSGHSVSFGMEAISRSIGSITRQSQGIIDVSKIMQETTGQAVESSAFLQDEWQISPALSVNLGLRSTYFSQGSYFRIEPRTSLAWQLGNVTLRAAAAVTNQFTHRIENGLVGNPSEAWFMASTVVKPAQALQFVVGTDIPLLDREYQLTIEAYSKTMQNLYDFKDSVQVRRGIPLFEQLTTGSGQAIGIELLLQKRVGQLTGWIGYTLAQTSRLYPELNEGKSFDAPFDRRHEIQAVASYKINDSWEIGAAFVFGSGQPFSAPVGVVSASSLLPSQSVSQPSAGTGMNSINVLISSSFEYAPQRANIRLPAYHRLDASATHKFTWLGLPFEVNISIINLYNHQNPLFWRLVSTGNSQTKTTYSLARAYALPILPTVGLRFTF